MVRLWPNIEASDTNFMLGLKKKGENSRKMGPCYVIHLLYRYMGRFIQLKIEILSKFHCILEVKPYPLTVLNP